MHDAPPALNSITGCRKRVKGQINLFVSCLRAKSHFHENKIKKKTCCPCDEPRYASRPHLVRGSPFWLKGELVLLSCYSPPGATVRPKTGYQAGIPRLLFSHPRHLYHLGTSLDPCLTAECVYTC